MFTVKVVTKSKFGGVGHGRDDSSRYVVDLSSWDVVRVWGRDTEEFSLVANSGDPAIKDAVAILVEELPDDSEDETKSVKQMLFIYKGQELYVTDSAGRTVYSIK